MTKKNRMKRIRNRVRTIMEASFSTEELEDFGRLVQIVWQKIVNLDLPDTTNYTPDYKGVLQFESDLLA